MDQLDSLLGATVQLSRYSTDRKVVLQDGSRDGGAQVISGVGLLTNNQVSGPDRKGTRLSRCVSGESGVERRLCCDRGLVGRVMAECDDVICVDSQNRPDLDMKNLTITHHVVL